MKVTEIEVCEIPVENGAMVKDKAAAETPAEAKTIEVKAEKAMPAEAKKEEPKVKADSAKKSEKKAETDKAADKAMLPEAKESKAPAAGKKKRKVSFGRDEWDGYSYDELRLQLLLTRTRIELNKSMVLEHGQNLMQRKSRPVSIMGRMLGALDYLDYGVLAYKLGRTIFKLFKR